MCTMLLIPLIPIAALVTQNMIILNNIIVRKADLQDSDLSVVKSDEQVNIYHYFGIDIYICWYEVWCNSFVKEINLEKNNA